MVKVYTKTGDKGFTTLFGGTKKRKSDARIQAYGEIDEANAAIGIAVNYVDNMAIKELLWLCQKKLFVLGAELASDDKGSRLLKEKINQDDVTLLEDAIDTFAEHLPQNRKFITPGLSKSSAYLHLARTVVRRAERDMVAIVDRERINPDLIVYINRLSDLLFTLSRAVDEIAIFKGKEEE